MTIKFVLGTVMAAVVLWGGLTLAEEVARPTTSEPESLPPAWQTVSPQKRLAAVRVAEVDADRLLVERIYGLHINATTSVLNLAMGHDDIQTAINTLIRGVRTQEIKYKDDLSVEAVREVTLREVVETIRRVVTREETNYSVKVDEIENISRRTRDKTLAVMGNGAVPGSLGQKRIQAKRAAELDCYRRIAERVLGVRVSADTTVQDFVLADDHILTVVAGCLAGVKFTKITRDPDNTYRVTGRLVLRDLLETVKRSYKRFAEGLNVSENEWRHVIVKNRDTVIVETGKGTPQPDGREEGIAVAPGRAYMLQQTIIKRIVRQKRPAVVE